MRPASMMLTAAVAAAVLLGLAGPGATQQQAPVADPARLAAVRELMQAQGSDAQFDVVIETMIRGMSRMLRQQHPGHAKEIGDVFSRVGAKFLARKGEVVDMVAPIYAARFTVEEIREMTAFYRTPVGAKLVKELPAISQQSIAVGMAWGQRIAAEVEREAREELKKKGLPL